MRKKGRILWGLLLPVLLPALAVASSARVYRRVDVSGTVRYTNIPAPRRPLVSSRVSTRKPRSGFRSFIRSAAHRHGIDPHLVEAIIAVESDFNPGAVSPKGAIGLMQLMPETADRYAVHNPFDPLQNIAGGIQYLRDLIHRFQGDLRAALAAYNAGETAVTKFQGIPPYRETRAYVKKVLQRYHGPTALLPRTPPRIRVYRFTGPGGRSTYTNIPPRIPLR